MQTLSQHQQLLQKLTPQQVQYLKLLQLPVLTLEQRIKQELELNPLLEEVEDLEQETAEEEKPDDALSADDASERDSTAEDGYTLEDFMNDDLSGYKAEAGGYHDEERAEMPLPAEIPLSQRIRDQLRYLELTPDEEMLGEEVIGNIDEDGYLRRDLVLIVQDLTLSRGIAITPEAAEEVLRKIQRLDPPGIGARTLPECLLAQLEVSDFDSELKDLALRVIQDQWEEFTMKHYEELAKNLAIDRERLRQVIELIQRLNPKPGEGEFTPQQNYIVTDFIVERDGNSFLVMLNDRSIPMLRVNRGYRDIMSKRKNNGVSVEAKDFIRKQFEGAKWFIASIHQRRQTMLRVMRSIVERQHDFFRTGENLRPMIYKDIAEMISMDISTISRVVNGKYVQTEYGVFELRHFFSDSIQTATGEEVSNKEVKRRIREIIDAEPADHPLSDDRIAEMLTTEGINIARRTVAKYREAMRIPVARLRRKA